MAFQERKKKSLYKRPDLHAAVMQAAEKAGEDFGSEGLVSYLTEQAKKRPNSFLSLLWKVISEEEAPLINIQRIEIVAPQLDQQQGALESSGIEDE